MLTSILLKTKKFTAWMLIVLLLTSCSKRFDEESSTTQEEPLSTSISALTAQTTPSIGRLTGINWFGFETSSYVVHGLWTRDYKSMLDQINELGFNVIRIPWSNEMLGKIPNGIQINPYGTDAYYQQIGQTNSVEMNIDLDGLTSIEVLHKIIDYANTLGLYIILDNHSRSADGYMNEALWYTDDVSEEQWIENWVYVVNEFKDYENFIGADLNNEPHDEATWDNWKTAAEKCGQAILDVRSDLLILIEGVEEDTQGRTYWWGGNLSDVPSNPVDKSIIPQQNLIYSPHEYGPTVWPQIWFSDEDFPANMPDIWDEYFWFIHQEDIAPILIGEFGIKHDELADTSSTGHQWMVSFLEYVGHEASWTFQTFNPNSGNTGGILEDDWVTIDELKYNLLKPYLEPRANIIDEGSDLTEDNSDSATDDADSTTDDADSATDDADSNTDNSDLSVEDLSFF